jgi:hypothetical protein
LHFGKKIVFFHEINDHRVLLLAINGNAYTLKQHDIHRLLTQTRLVKTIFKIAVKPVFENGIAKQ